MLKIRKIRLTQRGCFPHSEEGRRRKDHLVWIPTKLSSPLTPPCRRQLWPQIAFLIVQGKHAEFDFSTIIFFPISLKMDHLHIVDVLHLLPPPPGSPEAKTEHRPGKQLPVSPFLTRALELTL